MLALLTTPTGPFWFVAAVLALAVLTALLACYFFL
jgi:hypothetical protein